MEHKDIQLQTSDIQTDDQLSVFFRRKTQRMVTALYLVTALMDDKEPLKWQLRQKGVAVLTRTYSRLAEKDKREWQRDISDITTLLSVAKTAKLISDMNSSLIESVCTELLSLLDEMEERLLNISKQLFDANDMLEENKQNKGHDDSYTTSENLYDTASVSNRMSFKKPKEQSTKGIQKKKTPPNTAVGNNRKKKILTLLQNQSNATLSDIKEVITDVSDKTLQRDLAALIDEGTLKRTGSRRWTKYSLV